VTLAAFVVSNPLVFGHFPRYERHSTHSSKQAVEESASVCTTGCKHCRAGQVASVPAESHRGAMVIQVDSPCKGGPLHSQGSSCPCCPCPGGCAYCSVAKVPCCGVVLSGTRVQAACLDRSCLEASLLLPASHCREIIRPPRA